MHTVYIICIYTYIYISSYINYITKINISFPFPVI